MSTEMFTDETPLGSRKRVTADFDSPGQVLARLIAPLASLKLTVALFAMAIILILAGTLAQHRKDIWDVVEQYFRVPLWPTFGFAWFEFQDFLPPSFFPGQPQIKGGFYFPGGTLIGMLMAVNLLSAHGLRFKPQARGGRLWAGLGVIGIGMFVTGIVILSGSNKEGVHESVWGDWSSLWMLMQAGLGALFLTAVAGYAWLIARGESELWLLGLAGIIPAALGALFFYTVFGGEAAELDGPSMRILWQLMKGTAAGLVLLAGCALVFKKRAGVVLLHAGIGLMMFSEVQVALTAVETQMTIDEGESTNYAQDIRSVEFAVIDRSKPDASYNTVIPVSRLLKAIKNETAIQHPDLPFRVKPIQFMPNSNLRDVKPQDANKATKGGGLQSIAEPVRQGTGTDTESSVDIAAAYVELQNPKDGKPLGTWLVTPFLNPQPVKVGDSTYDVELRFQRYYKPYTVQLLDVQKNDYLGTSTARDYSSKVRLIDPTRQVDREIRIWMNNPLRFAGETFYQSNFNRRMVTQTDAGTGMRRPVLETDPVTGERRPKFIESTTLSVVTNRGWMIPYVSCMIVATGLLAHFGFVLVRFLNRQKKERKSAEPVFDEQGNLLANTATAVVATPEVKAAYKNAKKQKIKARRAKKKQKAGQPLPGEEQNMLSWLLPLAVVFVCALYVGSKARTPGPERDGMDLYAFGKIPVVFQGRQKPIDTLARNSLRVISDRQTFYGRMPDSMLKKQWPQVVAAVKTRWPKLTDADLKAVEFDVNGLVEVIDKQTDADKEEATLFVDSQVNIKQPAVRWLLDVIMRPDRAASHKVFRIENLDVLQTLGLERRSGFRYSLNEFFDKRAELQKQVDLAQALRKENPEGLSTFQRKILELDTRVNTFTLISESVRLPDLPELPAREDFQSDEAHLRAFQQAFPAFQQDYMNARRVQQSLEKYSPPLLVPVETSLQNDEQTFAALGPAQKEMLGAKRPEWETFTLSWLNDVARTRLMGQEANPPTAALRTVFFAYAVDDAQEFNSAVGRYHSLLAGSSDLQLDPLGKNRFEAFFNHFEPFFYSILLYLFAFILAALAWLFWRNPLNNAATWLITATLLLHTFALISRIYISGRPPVTNLYSSAVFIGWGAVVLGLVVEMIFKIGIGNIIASVAGFATLWIAHLLAGDGDTFTVLVAVLDTQFWLATHVTSITLGYATTFVAGLLGLLYVVLGFCTPSMTKKIGRDLGRMIYGVLCFAILFSFVGTVLGGLWADDSWGRFWGWDPKENGALIIVIWNALVLHARWDGMVKERGLAVLAIGGNIVTSWSWFGVNELGVGLHSYGFTDGVLLALGVFVISQLAFIGIGCMPKDMWWSIREQQEAASEA